MFSQPKKDKAASAEPRRETKTIDLRERMRIVEKTVVWMADGIAREAKQYRKRIEKVEQRILLLEANQCIADQCIKKMEKLEQDNLTLRADITAVKRGW